MHAATQKMSIGESDLMALPHLYLNRSLTREDGQVVHVSATVILNKLQNLRVTIFCEIQYQELSTNATTTSLTGPMSTRVANRHEALGRPQGPWY